MDRYAQSASHANAANKGDIRLRVSGNLRVEAILLLEKAMDLMVSPGHHPGACGANVTASAERPSTSTLYHNGVHGRVVLPGRQCFSDGPNHLHIERVQGGRTV